MFKQLQCLCHTPDGRVTEQADQGGCHVRRFTLLVESQLLWSDAQSSSTSKTQEYLLCRQ